ncbi:MBL fold metallo-hydrolase [Pseudonocardia sp. ICBG1293]|uniref:MBL fold metallo-hydrolase n=1 Tax=Pseudonocardia sp. ICBG1293 TaxID=2844382 RepID=UPI001CCB138A|nr:MBL fold metallo-hydrolase [Pseudonocardia sp. ICBG1293]
MRLRRLGWAGLEVGSGGRRLVIDHVRDVSTMFPGWRPGAGLVAPDGEVDAALVTHLHRDHTDAGALAAVLAPDAPVLRPAPGSGDDVDTAFTALAERELVEHRLRTEVVEEWSTRELGPFRVTAVPAVDGFGDPQVSWVVEADGRRILHGGDTLFHGHWWHVARRSGPFDAVFLPINGVVVDAPLRQPSSRLPAAMDPRQAAEAARILGARHLVPIHYEPEQADELDHYREVEDPVGELRRHAGDRVRVLAVGAGWDPDR